MTGFLCQVTSKPYGDRRALELCDSDFAAGGLRISSFVRRAKLFTGHQSLIVAEVGKLNREAIDRIIAAVTRVIQSNA
jgi:hypothetical protein